MVRSKWKGPYVNSVDLKTNNNLTKKNQIIMSRDSEIVPEFLGLTVLVHNGKDLLQIVISEDMIGHKLGEFAHTRAIFSFKKKKSKK